MVRALVLLNVNSGNEVTIVEELKTFQEVVDTFITFGDHDIACVINASSPKELGQIVTGRIRRINGVQKTITLIEAVEQKNQQNEK